MNHEQVDSSVAWSRSRCREQRLKNQCEILALLIFAIGWGMYDRPEPGYMSQWCYYCRFIC